MLRKSTPPITVEESARKWPHCRTCGKRMKGHRSDLCQLRSPSEESITTITAASTTPGSVFEGSADAESLPGTPPLTPTPTFGSLGSLQFRRVPFYPKMPMNRKPSWEAPPEGTFYHRRNPHIANPLTLSETMRGLPIQRTFSWLSTEKANSEVGDLNEPDCFSAPTTDETNASHSRAGRVGALPLTPPTSPVNSRDADPAMRVAQAERHVDVVDAAGNRVVGLDMSTLSENIQAIIRQADRDGYYATVVRPRIGHKYCSVDIRTKEDADKHTTVFVSTAPDTMSINLVCSEAFRKAKLIDEGGPCVTARGWLSVFLAMFLASLISFWGSVFMMRNFW